MKKRDIKRDYGIEPLKVLAFDFGASSGRAILGSYDGGKLSYKEIHRFENVPREIDGVLRWDFGRLSAEVKSGIEKAGEFDSIAFDTWGVDFGLLDKDGNLLEDPIHYRDGITDGMVEKAAEIVSEKELYAATGTQIMPINSLFRILAIREKEAEVFAKAERLLFMPDLFAYSLSGEAVCERSIASTAQLLSLPEGEWNKELIERFGLPEKLFLPTIPSGTVIGRLPENGAEVIAAAGHDTQCATAAVPSADPDVAFLSCGTWSLLGCELERPILTEESRKAGLSNELGADGKINYLKNIVGLWLIQESRREWKRQGRDYSFRDLEEMGQEAKPFRSFIDPDDPLFSAPGDLPARVKDYCRQTGQRVPEMVGEVVRTIYESLAFKYRYAIEQLEAVTKRKFKALHVVGGGTKDKTLLRMTSEFTGLPVIAGPTEATALGNIIIQLYALGALESLDEGRRLIAESERLWSYEPSQSHKCDDAYKRFKTLIEGR